MNRKQRIIVSVTGIILVTLMLLGLTYAYFLTKIKGNTNDKSISITTANLEIKYDDNNDIITGDKIEPGTNLPTKVFTVTNNGNMNVEYSVGLVNIINTFSITEDVVYTVTCKSYDKEGFNLGTDGTITGTENGTCSRVDETEFPTLNSYIVTNNIDVNIVHAYTMTVTYKETGIDQSIDMNKELSAKIDIFDPKSLTIQGNVTNSSNNDYVVIHSKEQESQILNGSYKFIGITPDTHTITVKNRKTTDTKSASLDVEKGTPSVSGSKIIYDEDKNVADMGISISDSTLTLDPTKISNPPQTLKDAILASAKKGGENRTVWGTSEIPTSENTTETERVLNSAPDDYGTSYYYRGNVLDNNVTFAGKNWKIVRINGDGSVRLVLDGSAGNSAFNKNKDDNAYLGYMYGLTGQTSANTNQCVKLNSAGTAAEVDTTNTTEEACVAVGNKWAPTAYDATHTNVVSSMIKTNLESWYKTNIIDTNNTGYIAENIFCNDKTLKSGTGIGKEYTDYNGQYATSLECAKGANNDYSRFTSKNNTSDTTIKGVKVNKDLTYPVGLLSYNEVKYAGVNQDNNDFLYNVNTSGWWLLSPRFYNGSFAYGWYFRRSYGRSDSSTLYYTYAIRPSINIKSSVLVDSGDGTSSNPYTLKLS